MRMDRYNDEKDNNEASISRVQRNQEMYNDVYLNEPKKDSHAASTNQEDIKEEINPVKTYEEKSYNINDYIQKAHEKLVNDNAMRDLNNQEFQKQEDEIAKLIASIDEKENNNDFFQDLIGTDEDTMIGGSMKTDEFDTNIYESIQEEQLQEKNEETILQNALSDDTVLNLEKKEDDKIDYTFQKIIDRDNKIMRRKKKIPIVVFCLTLFLLIVVIIIIILFK